MSTLGLLALGAVGGVLAASVGIPAGGLVGSLVAVGGFNLLREREDRLPDSFRVFARVVLGTVIGSLVTVELLRSVGWWSLLAVGAAVLLVLVGLACAAVLRRTTDCDRRTAIMAMSPGGLSEMAALSEELGCQASLVVAIHMVRKLLITVVAIVVLTAVTTGLL